MSSSSAIFKLSPLIGNCVFSEILSQIYIKQAHSERRRERKKKKKSCRRYCNQMQSLLVL